MKTLGHGWQFLPWQMGQEGLPSLMWWIPIAMVRIAAVFIAGILLSIYFPEALPQKLVTVFLISFTLFYFLIKFILDRSPAMNVASGIIGLSAIFFAGFLNVILKTDSLRADHLLQSNEPVLAYRIMLISSAEEKEKSWKRTGTLQAIRTSKGWRPVSGKVNLYWPKQEPINAIEYGDILLIKGSPNELVGPRNPFEFDFKKYLSVRNIYHQHYIRPGEWELVEKSSDHGFLFYAHRARAWSMAAIKHFIQSPQEQAIVIAFVLGVTDGIDNELRNAYAASGAMHVLAVSGLHVSILYGILLFFFRPIGKSAEGQWIIAITSLVLLWAYAFVTGLSPSVLRAVTMFSFVVLAKPIGKSTNIHNTLAASAFCLLLYDPYLIMSVGFQLSYLAVWGIVLIQRPLYNLWDAKSAILDWAWQITCVSIAAQVATFALGLFYFHQFPIYFLISNLFVIPGSFVVLVAGILLLMISPVPVVASWLGIGLAWFVKVLNEGLFFMERLPFSLINNIHISAMQCWLLIGMVLAGLLLIQTRKFQWAVIMTVVAAVFSFQSWSHLLHTFKKSSFTAYCIQGHHAMEWIDKGRVIFVADSSLANDPSRIRFHIGPNRLENGIREVKAPRESQFKHVQGLQFLRVEGRTFLWIQSKGFRLPEKATVDYLLVSNNSVGSLQELTSHINFNHLIFDSSNSYRYCERLEKEALDLNKPCFSVLKSGAYTVNL